MDLSFPVCVFTLLLVGCSYAQNIVINPEQDETVKQIKSESFTFTCSVVGLDDEVVDLSWTNENNEPIGGFSKKTNNTRIFTMRLENNKLALLFKRLVDDRDAGVYTCQGKINNKLQSAQIKLVLDMGVNVTSQPKQFPVVNTTSIINCKTTFAIPPKIRWWNGTDMSNILPKERFRQVTHGLEIKNVSKTDNGVYLCAVFQNGIMAKLFEITVTVTVPPRMKGLPTTHPDPVVGKPFAITCIADGTPKPKFTFRKDGIELKDGRYDVTSTENPQIDQTEGILKIEELVDTDRGDYVCVATNRGGDVQESVNVDVQVPPTVKKIGTTTANENKPGQLTCEARSNPGASLQWKITGTDISINADTEKGISFGEKVRQENDIYVVTKILKFKSLKPSDTNNYTCIATNSAGTDQKTGAIIVKFKPNFDNTPYSATYGWVNHKTEIKCVVDAVPPPSIKWFRGKNPITEGGPYEISQKEGVRQLTGILGVKVGVSNGDTIYGEYICKAQNMVDEASHTILLQKAEEPQQPSVSFGNITATTVELLIKPPSDNGGQPVIDYKIEAWPVGKKQNISRQSAEVSTDPTESRSRSKITGLHYKTDYYIEVWARNNVGYGQKIRVTCKTASLSVPGAPKIEANNEIGANSITLKWNLPNTGGAPITGYRIKYTEVVMTTPKEVKEVKEYIGETSTEKVDGGKTSKKLTNLKPDTDYELQLVAINSIGDGMATTLYFKTLQGGMPVSDTTGPAMETGAIIGILIAVIIILFIVIDVTFYFTKQCGLLWTLKGKVTGGEGVEGRADPETVDHEKEAFIKDGKQDSEEQSAKENVDVVNETEKGEEKEKELEPEDKEEKLETAPEPAEEVKEASSPATETAPTEPSTETAPPASTPDADKDPKV